MSSWSTLNHKQAVALAKFIHTLRDDWDIPGIEAHLGRAREAAPAPELAIAAILAASAFSNRTPAIIALPGEHWRSLRAVARPEKLAPEERCGICNKSRAMCARIAQVTGDDHVFTPDVPAEQLDPGTGELRPTPDAREQVARLRNLRNFAAANAAMPE